MGNTHYCRSQEELWQKYKIPKTKRTENKEERRKLATLLEREGDNTLTFGKKEKRNGEWKYGEFVKWLIYGKSNK